MLLTDNNITSAAMSYKGLPEHLVGRIQPVEARAYATASGWKRVQSINGNVAVFTHPSSHVDQLLIPVDASIADYDHRMAEVVVNLAEKEGRPALEILNDLLLTRSDVLRFSVDGPETQAGDVLLEHGINIFLGAKKAILAAACSVVQPQPFHPRLSRTEAEQLLASCRLGQTERGSFTAVVACPLDVAGTKTLPPRPMPLFEGRAGALDEEAQGSEATTPVSEPFARKVTSLLMRSLARITAAVDADRVQSLSGSGENEPLLSANLCEALLTMEPSGDRSRLFVSATWSRSLPPSPSAPPPGAVVLRKDSFTVISYLATTLRPIRGPKTSRFVGLVDALFGDPNESGQVSGEVQLLILNQEEARKARATLGPEDYHTAWEAHGVGGYVQLHGILIPGPRIDHIEHVTNFKMLKD